MIERELGEPAAGELNTRLRLLTWDDYGISPERLRELQHFCRQYPEKKARAKGSGDEYGLQAIRYDKGRSSSGDGRGPTEVLAIRNAARADKARRDCRMIETAATWAAEAGGYAGLASAILESVSKGTSYEHLCARYVLPFGKTDFYAVRRAFFYRLDTLQENVAPAIFKTAEGEKAQKESDTPGSH